MVDDDQELVSSMIRRDNVGAELTHNRENGSVTLDSATPSRGTKPVTEDDSPSDDLVLKQATIETVPQAEVLVREPSKHVSKNQAIIDIIGDPKAGIQTQGKPKLNYREMI